VPQRRHPRVRTRRTRSPSRSRICRRPVRRAAGGGDGPCKPVGNRHKSSFVAPDATFSVHFRQRNDGSPRPTEGALKSHPLDRESFAMRQHLVVQLSSFRLGRGRPSSQRRVRRADRVGARAGNSRGDRLPGQSFLRPTRTFRPTSSRNTSSRCTTAPHLGGRVPSKNLENELEVRPAKRQSRGVDGRVLRSTNARTSRCSNTGRQSQYPAALAFLMGQGELTKSFALRLLMQPR